MSGPGLYLSTWEMESILNDTPHKSILAFGNQICHASTFLFKFLPAIFAFAYILKFFGQVNASISSRDKYCIEVVLRCLSVVGDGIWPHEPNDGGILATVMAAGFKGETI